MVNKVIYSKCDEYSPEKINDAIDFIFHNLEGFEEKVKNAKKILIKPNLLAPRTPEQAVTTHPKVLISLINKIKPYGAEIIVGDTPAGSLTEKVLEKLYSKTGMHKVAEATGCKLNTDLTELNVDTPDAKMAKAQKILKIAEDADLIINVAKLKTHCFTLLTCATKNHFGIVPGLLKIKFHLTLPDTDLFANLLLDIERYFDHKSIHLVDGIIGMEGNGPSNGSPINAKCILASNDSIYLDILACHIMGINPENITTITEAYKRKLIDSKDFDDLVIIKNAGIETFKFKLPPDRGSTIPSFIPDWVRNFFNQLLIPRPIIEKDRCIGCRACQESCPPQLIKVLDGLASIDDYGKCIKCYCCQEVCPEDAISLEKPAGRRIMEKFKIK